MEKKNEKNNFFNKLITGIVVVSLVIAILTIIYFYITLKRKPLVFANLSSFEKKLYICMFISVITYSTILIVFMISSIKQDDDNYNNYTVVKTEDYDSITNKMIEQEYLNMKQSNKIRKLETKLLSKDLTIKIIKIIFKHSKSKR